MVFHALPASCLSSGLHCAAGLTKSVQHAEEVCSPCCCSRTGGAARDGARPAGGRRSQLRQLLVICGQRHLHQGRVPPRSARLTPHVYGHALCWACCRAASWSGALKSTQSACLSLQRRAGCWLGSGCACAARRSGRRPEGAAGLAVGQPAGAGAGHQPADAGRDAAVGGRAAGAHRRARALGGPAGAVRQPRRARCRFVAGTCSAPKLHLCVL